MKKRKKSSLNEKFKLPLPFTTLTREYVKKRKKLFV